MEPSLFPSLDPDLVGMVRFLPEVEHSLDDLEGARAMLATMVTPASEVDTTGLDIRDLPLDDFDSPAWVRVYRPTGAEGPLPGLLHIHGGGFVLGSVDVEHQVCVDLARDARCRRGERGVPARPRAPLPRRPRGLLRRAPPAGRPARRRPGPGRGARPERGRWTRRRRRPAGPRPRRPGAVLPVARRARARRPAGDHVDAVGRPVADVEPRARRRPRGSSTSTAVPPTSTPLRAAPRTWPACPRRTSSPASSTRCATRATSTPRG